MSVNGSFRVFARIGQDPFVFVVYSAIDGKAEYPSGFHGFEKHVHGGGYFFLQSGISQEGFFGKEVQAFVTEGIRDLEYRANQGFQRIPKSIPVHVSGRQEYIVRRYARHVIRIDVRWCLHDSEKRFQVVVDEPLALHAVLMDENRCFVVDRMECPHDIPEFCRNFPWMLERFVQAPVGANENLHVRTPCVSAQNRDDLSIIKIQSMSINTGLRNGNNRDTDGRYLQNASMKKPQFPKEWDCLDPKARQDLVSETISYLRDDHDFDIGMITANEIVDFFLERTYPAIRNKTLEDSKAVFHLAMDTAEVNLEALRTNR